MYIFSSRIQQVHCTVWRKSTTLRVQHTKRTSKILLAARKNHRILVHFAFARHKCISEWMWMPPSAARLPLTACDVNRRSKVSACAIQMYPIRIHSRSRSNAGDVITIFCDAVHCTDDRPAYINVCFALAPQFDGISFKTTTAREHSVRPPRKILCQRHRWCRSVVPANTIHK